MNGRRTQLDAWVSTIARIIGLALLLAFGVEWILTQQSEPILVGAALTLYGAGAIGRARVLLNDPPPPAGDARAADERGDA